MWHGQDPVAVFSDVIRYVTQCPPWEDMQYCLCSQNISEHLRPSYLMSAEVWVFQFPLAAGKPTITCGCPLAGEGVVAIRPSFLTLGPILYSLLPFFSRLLHDRDGGSRAPSSSVLPLTGLASKLSNR